MPRSPGTNPVASALILIGNVAVIVMLSWMADPVPFLDLMDRSIPVIAMFSILSLIPVGSASVWSRIVSDLLLVAGAVILIFGFGSVAWGVSYILMASMVACDVAVSKLGCKSIMDSSINDNFMLIPLVYMASFAIGFVFEAANTAWLHLWVIGSVDAFYPMVTIYGANLMIVTTWSIIGVAILEFATLVMILFKKGSGNQFACRLE
jgi:hypothetical protein